MSQDSKDTLKRQVSTGPLSGDRHDMTSPGVSPGVDVAPVDSLPQRTKDINPEVDYLPPNIPKENLRRQMSTEPFTGDLHDMISPGVSPGIDNAPLSTHDLENDKKMLAFQAQNQFLLDVLGSDDYVPAEANRYVKDMIDQKNTNSEKSVVILKKFSVHERIEQVQNGSYIDHCCAYPRQDLNKGKDEFQTKDDQYEFNISNNYKKLEDGSLEMTNKWLLKKQKQVLGYIVKQFGSALVSGKSVMNISLPITIFEPKSLLERLADSFVFAPHFLEKVGLTDNTLEQFKLALTFYLTCLPADLNPEKPFNPILGETFQGIIGGCPVYIEQISHHPPIAAFQMIGKNFRIEGSFEFFASISANSVKARRIGDFKLIFKNTGAVVEVQFPIGVMSGTSFGKRAWQYIKKMHVYDLANQHYAEIDFEKSESSKKRKEMPGYFTNNIYKITDKFAAKIRQDSQKQKDFELKFKEKEHATAKLDMFEGSWLEGLIIGNQPYWTNTVRPYKLEYFDNPLPSDCNFRLDLLYLKAGDEIKAQDAKVAQEETQRKDKKLREHSKTKNLK